MRYVVLLLLCLPGVLAAHQASDSHLELALTADDFVVGRWDIALRDLDLLLPLDANADRAVTWGELTDAVPALHALAGSTLRLTRGKLPCNIGFVAPAVAVAQRSDGAYAVLALRAECPGTGALMLDYHLLEDIDAGHRALLHAQAAGVERVLIVTPGEPLVLDAGSTAAGAAGFLRLGVHHIATGYDHLLFLLTLLLPVSARMAVGAARTTRRALRDALWIVTTFTLAHSLTLALAALGVFALPGRLVESAIAISVLVAALDNLRAGDSRLRLPMVFGFGLVHGLGFAAMLSGLPATTGARLLALGAFNLGVELGQLVAVCVFLPVALLLARHVAPPRFAWGLRAASVVVALVASAWFVERAFGVSIGMA